MRRRIETIAGCLPGFVFLWLLAAFFTLIMVDLTDGWLPRYFIEMMREATGLTHAAGTDAFGLFFITAMLLYVLALSACGLAVALVLRAGVKLMWQLAGR